MYKKAKEEKVYWPVTLLQRDAEGGEPVEAKVYILFRIYKRSERNERKRLLNEAFAKLTAAKPGEEFTAANAAVEAIKDQAEAEVVDRVCGWREYVDADGQPVPFTAAERDELLDDESNFERIKQALHDASTGARAKNSSPGAAG